MSGDFWAGHSGNRPLLKKSRWLFRDRTEAATEWIVCCYSQLSVATPSCLLLLQESTDVGDHIGENCFHSPQSPLSIVCWQKQGCVFIPQIQHQTQFWTLCSRATVCWIWIHLKEDLLFCCHCSRSPRVWSSCLILLMDFICLFNGENTANGFCVLAALSIVTLANISLMLYRSHMA